MESISTYLHAYMYQVIVMRDQVYIFLSFATQWGNAGQLEALF